MLARHPSQKAWRDDEFMRLIAAFFGGRSINCCGVCWFVKKDLFFPEGIYAYTEVSREGTCERGRRHGSATCARLFLS